MITKQSAMAQNNHGRRKLEKIDIPTLVLPYEYKPLPMTTTKSFSEAKQAT